MGVINRKCLWSSVNYFSIARLDSRHITFILPYTLTVTIWFLQNWECFHGIAMTGANSLQALSINSGEKALRSDILFTALPKHTVPFSPALQNLPALRKGSAGSVVAQLVFVNSAGSALDSLCEQPSTPVPNKHLKLFIFWTCILSLSKVSKVANFHFPLFSKWQCLFFSLNKAGLLGRSCS